MLEALKASAERPQIRPEGAPPSELGDFALHPTSGEGMTLPLGTMPFLLLQLGLLVLVFSIGYLVGQGSEPVQAGAGGDPIDLQSPTGSGVALGSSEPAVQVTPARPDDQGPGPEVPSAAERAFLDPANKYTVVVFTAENSEFGKSRAWAMHDYLADQTYPVVEPRHWKGEVKIFVGAAPTTGGLADLEVRLRQDPGPDDSRPFYDAYVDNADRFR